jgi:hypothetical protein
MFGPESLTPRTVLKTWLELVRAAEGIAQFIPGAGSRLAWREFQNKLRAFYFFEHADSILDSPQELSEARLLRGLARLDTADSVWAAEGIGRHYANSRLADHSGAWPWLTNNLANEALRFRVPFHTGMGLALAESWLHSAHGADSPTATGLRGFLNLCGINSRDGFSGAVYETLGLACRTQYPHMVRRIDELLLEINPVIAAYFWHGVGRGLYFLPTGFIPGARLTYTALRKAHDEPPHELGRSNAAAGVAWALTLVNMRDPQIMEDFLKNYGASLPDGEAFANGVQAALTIWHDCAGEDPFLRTFSEHRPDSGDDEAVRLWRRYAGQPSQRAAENYQRIARNQQIGELFRNDSFFMDRRTAASFYGSHCRQLSSPKYSYGILARLIRTRNWMIATTQTPSTREPLTAEDRLFVAGAERYLGDGLALKKWWEGVDASNHYEERFELARTVNRPGTSYGFFGHAPTGAGLLPVMGNFQQMLYDRPKLNARIAQEPVEWVQQQIREFALHYFMRVSSFRQPEAYVESNRPPSSPWLERVSACTQARVVQQGFGFSQLYYKLAATGEIGKFSDEEKFAIVDLREVGTKYEWLVVKVRIFDFSLKLRPFGESGPELVFGLDEESYLILNREFVVDQVHPAPGVRGRYGLGYAFIKSPSKSFLAYGPGEFDAAFELIQFDVLDSGEIQVRMVFVVNRPERIVNVPITPVDWSFRLADVFTLGMSSKLLAPVKNVADRFPLQFGNFDPVYTSINLLNAFTGNQAAQQLCISKEQLDKAFLLQHFMQHYETIAGSLMTWRQIGDWLDAASLPDWVISGRG